MFDTIKKWAVAILIALAGTGGAMQLGGLNTVNSPATATSSAIMVGTYSPGSRAVATSTTRSHLLLSLVGSGASVYCNVNDGNIATMFSGIHLSSTTPTYEMSVDKGNLSTDAVLCIAVASSTPISVIEFNTSR